VNSHFWWVDLGMTRLVPVTPDASLAMHAQSCAGNGNKIIRCELSLDDGKSWRLAQVTHSTAPNAYGKHWAWVWWSLEVPIGECTSARAAQVWMFVLLCPSPLPGKLQRSSSVLTCLLAHRPRLYLLGATVCTAQSCPVTCCCFEPNPVPQPSCSLAPKSCAAPGTAR